MDTAFSADDLADDEPDIYPDPDTVIDYIQTNNPRGIGSKNNHELVNHLSLACRSVEKVRLFL